MSHVRSNVETLQYSWLWVRVLPDVYDEINFVKLSISVQASVPNIRGLVHAAIFYCGDSNWKLQGSLHNGSLLMLRKHKAL